MWNYSNRHKALANVYEMENRMFQLSILHAVEFLQLRVPPCRGRPEAYARCRCFSDGALVHRVDLVHQISCTSMDCISGKPKK
jgi:hypothetical protein